MKTPIETFNKQMKEFDDMFLTQEGRVIGNPRPSLMNKGLTNVKSHIRSTVIAILKAEIERVDKYFPSNTGMSYDNGVENGKSEESARIRANLQETVDNLEKLF